MNDAARCLAAYCPPVGLLLLLFLFTLLVPLKRMRTRRVSKKRRF